MPDLNFEVKSAEHVTHAASPTLALKLAIHTDSTLPIHSILLRTQIMIEVSRRHYSASEQEQLFDIFGPPERWSDTLKSMLWTHVVTVVPAFQGTTEVDLLVPCSFDFNVAAIKYFHGLEKGEIPLTLLFSGTIFYATELLQMQVAQIPWEKETKFRLPVETWRDVIEHYYPNSVWLCLRKDVFQRLYIFKMQNGIPTWEETIEEILPDRKKDDAGWT